MVDQGAVTGAAAKAVFEEMLAHGGKPGEIAARRGLDRAMSGDEISAAVDAVLARNPDKVAAYRAGKKGLLGLFTGQVMKATGGRAEPQAVQESIRRKLG